jgi:hypothetical protein
MTKLKISRTEILPGYVELPCYIVRADDLTRSTHVREAKKNFADLINSGDGVAKMFQELTRLTVDLARELRTPVKHKRGKAGEVAPALDVYARRHPPKDHNSRAQHQRAETSVRYCRTINPILRRIRRLYPTECQLVIGPDLDVPAFSDEPAVHQSEHSWGERIDKITRAQDGMDWFRLLARDGAFSDIRRCALMTCNKYFFPLRPERRYCSDKCQRKHYKQSAEYKTQTANYQKAYYEDYGSTEAKKYRARHGMAALHRRHEERQRERKKSLALLKVSQQ